MTTQEVTLSLPETTYNQIRLAVEKAHRSAVMAAAPMLDAPAGPLRIALAQLAYHDAALWQAARSTMPPVQRERLEELHLKQ